MIIPGKRFQIRLYKDSQFNFCIAPLYIKIESWYSKIVNQGTYSTANGCHYYI